MKIINIDPNKPYSINWHTKSELSGNLFTLLMKYRSFVSNWGKYFILLITNCVYWETPEPKNNSFMFNLLKIIKGKDLKYIVLSVFNPYSLINENKISNLSNKNFCV